LACSRTRYVRSRASTNRIRSPASKVLTTPG
jgi:hypothetical protein